MVNKRLLDLAERLGRQELPKEFGVPRLDGFSYVPDLGFYVADEVSYKIDGKDWDWHGFKELLKERNSFMLNPLQFWIHHVYCSSNKPDLVESFFQNEDREYLDAYIEGTNSDNLDREPQLIINSEWARDSDNKSRCVNGDFYPLEKHHVQEHVLRFYRPGVSRETGLPIHFQEEGIHQYVTPFHDSGQSLSVRYIGDDGRLPFEDGGLTFKFVPRGVVSMGDVAEAGVRECKYLEDGK